MITLAQRKGIETLDLDGKLGARLVGLELSYREAHVRKADEQRIERKIPTNSLFLGVYLAEIFGADEMQPTHPFALVVADGVVAPAPLQAYGESGMTILEELIDAAFRACDVGHAQGQQRVTGAALLTRSGKM